MNPIENRFEDIIEPDLLDWDTTYEIDEDEFIEILEILFEDELEDFIDPKSAEGNLICADNFELISAD